jgi:hypothetical protein
MVQALGGAVLSGQIFFNIKIFAYRIFSSKLLFSDSAYLIIFPKKRGHGVEEIEYANTLILKNLKNGF